MSDPKYARYNASPKGRTRTQRYNASEKRAAVTDRYLRTERGGLLRAISGVMYRTRQRVASYEPGGSNWRPGL